MSLHFYIFSLLVTLSTYVLAAPTCGLVPQNTVLPNVHSYTNVSEDVLLSAWYPGWLTADGFGPSNISWSMYNSLTFAFATTTNDASVLSLGGTEATLQTFVQLAQENNVNASVSIGGWTGSQYFSMAMATDTNRTAFLGAVLGLVKTYNLDGIDFDWEYPNKQGIGCNIISPNDSANFLVFLQALRQQAPNLVISLAVGITPFLDATGTPMTDVSGFAKVVDHIAIMAYDIWGSWSTGGVGPNAPLDDSCAPVKDGSATSAVEAWTAANFPADQIALGVPAYGHSFHVDSTSAYSSAGVLAAYPPFDKALQPLGNDDGNGTITNDQCGNPTGPGGVFDFYAMIDSGFLNMDGDPAPGIDYRWDNCSQTPYVYNHTSQIMISYDNNASFIAKGNFINAQGLKGYSMWQSQGDYNNILTKALHAAMGIQSDCSTD